MQDALTGRNLGLKHLRALTATLTHISRFFGEAAFSRSSVSLKQAN
jgi:hypothetical protein